MITLNETLNSIKAADKDSMSQARARIDILAKPIGSLGILEEIAEKIAGITGKVHNRIQKKAVIVMCADNGVTEEGVSAAPQSVTALLTENMAKGLMGVCSLSRIAGADVKVVDIGVKAKFNNPNIIDIKIAYGTENIAKGPAMKRDDAIRAVEVGIEMVDKLAKEGYDLLGTGELGIGNTTTSAAVLSAFSGLSPDVTVGMGVGLTREQFENKKDVVKRALKVNNPDKNDVFDVISKVGGLDIAGLCGCFLGAAKNRIPIVIDGYISSAAALCAYKLNPLVHDFMFPSHLSAEQGASYMMKELKLEPMVNLKMRLGEGSGCPFAFYIIESAVEMINSMGTFEEAMINNNFLVDIR
ncbi:MAG: nicotinate-nucleotide--dimethylbenzimidazole phosphoribosyltransferase [Acetivibrionales bacterium]|jgi:nicotinate-nucleotide--dimethylbenzimidazole phosphoribosyltransferase